MKKEFIVNRQGKDFVLYAGLLDEAHRQGLVKVRTTLVQAPTDENGRLAIVHATVTTDKGEFDGIGDASPENVGRMIAPHTVRMAETRAKARALRDAVNVGVTAFEELGEPDEEKPPAYSPSPRPKVVPNQERREPQHATIGADGQVMATQQQRDRLIKLSRAIGAEFDDQIVITSDAAAERIREMVGIFNAQAKQQASQNLQRQG